MTLNRRTALGLAALAATPAMARPALADTLPIAPPDPLEILRLWPDGAPRAERVTVTPRVVERSTDPGFHDRFAQLHHRPHPDGAEARPAERRLPAADPRRRVQMGGGGQRRGWTARGRSPRPA